LNGKHRLSPYTNFIGVSEKAVYLFLTRKKKAAIIFLKMGFLKKLAKNEKIKSE